MRAALQALPRQLVDDVDAGEGHVADVGRRQQIGQRRPGGPGGRAGLDQRQGRGRADRHRRRRREGPLEAVVRADGVVGLAQLSGEGQHRAGVDGALDRHAYAKAQVGTNFVRPAAPRIAYAHVVGGLAFVRDDPRGKTTRVTWAAARAPRGQRLAARLNLWFGRDLRPAPRSTPSPLTLPAACRRWLSTVRSR